MLHHTPCTHPPQAIGRAVPPHQRGNVRMVCRTWCRAVTDDVSCLQLPLSALAPPPRWHAMLLPPTQPPVWGWPRGPGRHSPAYREAHGLQGSPKGEGLEGREEQQVSDGGRKRQRGQGEVAEQGEAAAELGARDNSTIDGEEQEHQRQMEELRLLAARSPHLAAVRRLFMRFRSCRHVVLVHNTVLPPQDVQVRVLGGTRWECSQDSHRPTQCMWGASGRAKKSLTLYG